MKTYILNTDLVGVSWMSHGVHCATIKAGQTVKVYVGVDSNRIAFSVVDIQGNPVKIELASAFPQFPDITHRDTDDRFVVNIEEFKKATGGIGDWSK